MPASHNFISYSSADAPDFAFKLHDALEAGPPHIPAWLDKRDLKPGADWDDQIDEAIRDCDALIFVMTRDSVESRSVCKREWSRALSYKKPVVPLLLDRNVEIPFRLAGRQYIDFTGSFDQGMAKLREYLAWLNTPEGLQALEDRLANAKRELRRADDLMRGRIEGEIARLEADIARQQALIADPETAMSRTTANIMRGLERERKPLEKAVTKQATRSINPPPGIAPDYFQDREVETGLLVNFLKDPPPRLIIVAGRGGIGKTALVCRLLKSLESGKVPDTGEGMLVDGIVYLSAAGLHRCDLPTLYADLCRLLPKDKADELNVLYRDVQVTITEKMQTLLTNFPPAQRVLLLLDNFEDMIDFSTDECRISDSDLNEALRAILLAPPHGLKVIITTRVVPTDLLVALPPGRYVLFHLDSGLPSPYAENILRAMDIDGKLGLRGAPDETLRLARERTRGYPRALEALVAILEVDTDTSLDELLTVSEKYLPENVTSVLVGESFSRLDPRSQGVMQALAIYDRPVPSTAVDYVLQPYLPDIDSQPILSNLMNMHFVRRESGRYYLHPVDRNYALSRIPSGNLSDRFLTPQPEFTQGALRVRGADYFAQVRKPRQEWETIDDLAPQLAEFELRCENEDYEAAANVLLDIDLDYLMLWGLFRMTASLHERLQGNLTNPELRRRSLSNLGLVYHFMSKIAPAISCYQQALTLAQQEGNSSAECKLLSELGGRHADLSEYNKAIEYYQKALIISIKAGDTIQTGAIWGNLGNVHVDLGHYEWAIEYYEQGLAIAREVQDRQGEANRLGNLGNVYAVLQKHEQASDYYSRALTISREIGDRRGEVIDLGNLGSVYTVLKDYERAIAYYEQALAISEHAGDRHSQGIILDYLGSVYADSGQYERAIEYYNQALTIATQLGERREESKRLANLGHASRKQKQYAPAQSFYEQALGIARDIADRYNEANYLGNLGNIYADLEQRSQAIDCYEKARDIFSSLGMEHLVKQTEVNINSVKIPNAALSDNVKGETAGFKPQQDYEQPRTYAQKSEEPVIISTSSGEYDLRQIIRLTIEAGVRAKADSDRIISVRPLFGLPSAKSQFKCTIFVIMPFAEEFKPIYTDHIVPTVESLDLTVKRGDDFFSTRSVMDEIWSALNACQIVIAECTGRNPNVFYELGIAHTLGKPVIMIVRDIDDIPFDLKHLRIIVYDYIPRGMKVFEQDLKQALVRLIEDLKVDTNTNE